MILIPAGWFLMGCDGQDNEKPVRRVWIDEFFLAAYQVTHADYARFVADTNGIKPPFWSDSSLNQPDHPVVGVSWHEAVHYCDWLSGETGRQFRLPTEAEWERAARGGLEGMLFPWGNETPQSLPGYAERWRNGPEAVGHSDANGFGLYNMCDNVHEWCSDWYTPNYYENAPERNPRGPEGGERRASRGGSWRHHIKISRCAARSSIPPEFHYADYGFRVACDV
jgi:formylglycine-generating enzyme required for sulfatase activity